MNENHLAYNILLGWSVCSLPYNSSSFCIANHIFLLYHYNLSHRNYSSKRISHHYTACINFLLYDLPRLYLSNIRLFEDQIIFPEKKNVVLISLVNWFAATEKKPLGMTKSAIFRVNWLRVKCKCGRVRRREVRGVEGVASSKLYGFDTQYMTK